MARRRPPRRLSGRRAPRAALGHAAGTPRRRPLFWADAADMPFADHAFDYVICSHVLEHVPDPPRVIGELTRVAKAGYVEVPEASAAKLQDFPTHLWWCRLDRSTDAATLVFTAKTTPYFDQEIDGYLKRAGLEKQMAACCRPASREHRRPALGGRAAAPRRGELDPAFVERVSSDGRAAPRRGVAGVAGAHPDDAGRPWPPAPARRLRRRGRSRRSGPAPATC